MKTALATIVQNLIGVLERHDGNDRFAIRRTGRHLPLLYIPRFPSSDGGESAHPGARGTERLRPVEPIGPAAPVRASGTGSAIPRPTATTVNMRCTSCPDRIYAVRRYRIDGRLPILLLRYNYPLDEKAPAHPDRSAKGLFATPEEDDLFLRMIQAAGLDVGDLHVQEFPACHFDQRSLPEDWNARTRACLEHVSATVRERSIQQILVTGAAAVLLFGDEAQGLAEKGQSFPLEVMDPPVSCLVIRSPAALLAMERRRLSIEKSLERFPEERKVYETMKAQPAVFKRHADEALMNLSSEDQPGSAKGMPRSADDPNALPGDEGIKVVAGIRLKSASSVPSPQSKVTAKRAADEIEFERFRSAGKEGEGLLFRLQRLRENEAKVKRQILDALRSVKAAASEGRPSV